ncbi:hypothetical protein AHAS_Ahas13G0015300 [Arachis hypogaea]
MKKVQEEVRRIVGGKSMIEENDINQMKYMKCVIKETLRLHPPGPFLIPRETANSVEIKGYHIPKKVAIYINSYAIHRDPKLWDNAEEFIPERFEGTQQVDYKGIGFQLIPFGIGRRACPGVSFAVASLEYVMANLLYLFDWKFTRRNNKFNNLPPSPPKLPIIGNLHQLGTLPHQSLKALANKYGPLLLLQLGQTQALVVSSAELVEEIAKSHDIAFSNRANTKAAKIFFYQCKEPIRKDEVSMMINTICEACAKGSIVNLSKMIITTANNISSRCIFGRSFDGRKGIGEVVRKMMSQLTTLGIGDLFPSLDWVDVLTGFNSRLKVTFDELDAFLEEVIEEHKRKKKDKNIINDRSYDNKDFIDIFLQLQEKNMLEFELTGDTIRGILMV